MMIDLTSRKNTGVDAIITNVLVPALTSNSDARYIHTQVYATQEVTVTHNLNKLPSVTFVNEDGEAIIADYTYLSDNKVKCSFDEDFIGYIYFN